jgi:hypothetical protein
MWPWVLHSTVCCTTNNTTVLPNLPKLPALFHEGSLIFDLLIIITTQVLAHSRRGQIHTRFEENDNDRRASMGEKLCVLRVACCGKKRELGKLQ